VKKMTVWPSDTILKEMEVEGIEGIGGIEGVE
jgi:hypothetical protein